MDRVALCWLHLHYAEGTYAQKMDGLDAAWSEHHQRRIDRAQRRYLQAIRTLAQVRRLAVPATNVQVNLGQHQVNQMTPTVRTVASGAAVAAAERAARLQGPVGHPTRGET